MTHSPSLPPHPSSPPHSRCLLCWPCVCISPALSLSTYLHISEGFFLVYFCIHHAMLYVLLFSSWLFSLKTRLEHLFQPVSGICPLYAQHQIGWMDGQMVFFRVNHSPNDRNVAVFYFPVAPPPFTPPPVPSVVDSLLSIPFSCMNPLHHVCFWASLPPWLHTLLQTFPCRARKRTELTRPEPARYSAFQLQPSRQQWGLCCCLDMLTSHSSSAQAHLARPQHWILNTTWPYFLLFKRMLYHSPWWLRRDTKFLGNQTAVSPVAMTSATPPVAHLVLRVKCVSPSYLNIPGCSHTHACHFWVCQTLNFNSHTTQRDPPGFYKPKENPVMPPTITHHHLWDGCPWITFFFFQETQSFWPVCLRVTIT